MGQIATKGWIDSNKKTISGWSGENKCPTKSEIESADSSLEVSGSYASNQLVQQDDINVYGWKYYFSGAPTSISDNGTGGTYTINVDSRRVRTIDGVETDTFEYVEWTFSENLSWVSGVKESSGSNAERLRVTVNGGYQSGKSGSITFQQTGTSNTFSVPVSIASRYVLRYTGLSPDLGIGLFNTSSSPNPSIDYRYMVVSDYSGILETYNDSGFLIADVATVDSVRVYLGDTIYVREKQGTSWGLAIEVTLGIDTTVDFSL